MAKENSILPVGDRTKAATNNVMDMWRQSIDDARKREITVNASEDASKPRMDVGLYKKDCKTCAQRKYQDGSDDPGVSFKTPGHISPTNSAAAVMSHEREHVVRNAAKAEREGGKVVASSVTLHYSFCPECGRPYVAGGTTRTTTSAPADKNEGASNPASLFDAKI